jgi:hypothetical protein
LLGLLLQGRLCQINIFFFLKNKMLGFFVFWPYFIIFSIARVRRHDDLLLSISLYLEK